MENTPENPEIRHLQFRRQFLLGKKVFRPDEHWSEYDVDDSLKLSVQVDLPCCRAEKDRAVAFLLGIAIDPFHPESNEQVVLDGLMEHAGSRDAFLEATKPLAGRWVILLRNKEDLMLLTDPCGFRTVFYHFDGEEIYCASQPALIGQVTELIARKDEDLQAFLKSKVFEMSEYAWVGQKTLFENCYHLLPNHFLDLNARRAVRFYPDSPLVVAKPERITERAGEILRGILQALASRYSSELALTAGWDSRVLLAASKDVKDKLAYFVYHHETMTEKDPDLWLSAKIARFAGISFEVRKPSAERLPDWFRALLSHNVTGARLLPKTNSIFHKLVSGKAKVNINGNGSEICRNFFDHFLERRHEKLTVAGMADLLYGSTRHPAFLLQELEEWKDGFGAADKGYSLKDFLYWEQRIGNWGAQFPSEQDVAAEEISPFNCRLLLELLLSVPATWRKAPDYKLYKALIDRLWPELNVFPVNPPRRYMKKIMQNLRSHTPDRVVSMAKKIRNYRF